MLQHEVLHDRDSVLMQPSRDFYGWFYDPHVYAQTWAQLRQCEQRQSCIAVISSEAFAEIELVAWKYLLQALPGWKVTVVPCLPPQV